MDHLESFGDLTHARLSVFKYIETFYNPTQLHQTLGYKSPDHFESEYAPASAAQPSPPPVFERFGLSHNETRESLDQMPNIEQNHLLRDRRFHLQRPMEDVYQLHSRQIGGKLRRTAAMVISWLLLPLVAITGLGSARVEGTAQWLFVAGFIFTSLLSLMAIREISRPTNNSVIIVTLDRRTRTATLHGEPTKCPTISVPFCQISAIDIDHDLKQDRQTLRLTIENTAGAASVPVCWTNESFLGAFEGNPLYTLRSQMLSLIDFVPMNVDSLPDPKTGKEVRLLPLPLELRQMLVQTFRRNLDETAKRKHE